MSPYSSTGRPPAFVYRKAKGQENPELYCENVSLTRLSEKLGTPLYVYSANTIRQRQKSFDQAFRAIPHTVCYSVKANSNLSILRLLAKLGCGFDVVSGGELERVMYADRRAAKKVVFSGVGKTVEEMRAALKADILLFNIESTSELALLAECAAKLNKTARMALRVNPDVSAETHPYISTGLHKHKFGLPIQQAQGLYAVAAKQKYLQAAGVSVHIGSQILDVSPFAAAMERVAELIRGLREQGHPIKYVDAGGGLGIAYRDENLPELNDQAKAYAEALTTPLRQLKLHLLLEPGRSIVAPAGALLTRVLYRKTNNGKKFLIVDAAMNDLLRPSLYQAYHEIVPVEAESSDTEITDVVGPICETGDFFARDRELPVVDEGALLALLDTGAYGLVLSSNYNTRPRAAEVLVDGSRFQVIRRRETVADLLRAEKR